jgi:plasmid stability protein
MPLEPDPFAGLTDLPPGSLERIRMILPHWVVRPGSVEGRWGCDGRFFHHLRVQIPRADGRRSRLSIGLGCGALLAERVVQALADYCAQHWNELPERLQRKLKLRAARAARSTLQKLAPSRAAFRQAWKQISDGGLPADPAEACAYARLVALQLPTATRGRPRKCFFARPASPFQVPKPDEVPQRDYLVASMVTPGPKASRWNPHAPLQVEDYALPGGLFIRAP